MIHQIVKYNNKTYTYYDDIHVGIIMDKNDDTHYVLLLENGQTLIGSAGLITFLPIQEQIEKFNEVFYQYLSLPEHLILKEIK